MHARSLHVLAVVTTLLPSASELSVRQGRWSNARTESSELSVRQGRWSNARTEFTTSPFPVLVRTRSERGHQSDVSPLSGISGLPV